MNSLLHTRLLAAAALALGVFGAASAHARSDVNFFVGFGGPVYLEPAPVYVQPRPVYVQPQPVYVQQEPVYSQPPVYVQHNAPAYQYSYEDERARRHAEWRRWQWRQQQHNRHDWEHAREHEHEHEHEREHERDHERHGRD